MSIPTESGQSQKLTNPLNFTYRSDPVHIRIPLKWTRNRSGEKNLLCCGHKLARQGPLCLLKAAQYCHVRAGERPSASIQHAERDRDGREVTSLGSANTKIPTGCSWMWAVMAMAWERRSHG
jgi:hypothetical protein